jgi:hypothetical protein
MSAPFRHADHVELAWRLLAERPFEAAFAELERRLRALAAAAGRPEKYDAAMTRAYLQIIDERRRDPGIEEAWAAFVARNGDLFADGAALVAAMLARVLAFPPC